MKTIDELFMPYAPYVPKAEKPVENREWIFICTCGSNRFIKDSLQTPMPQDVAECKACGLRFNIRRSLPGRWFPFQGDIENDMVIVIR